MDAPKKVLPSQPQDVSAILEAWHLPSTGCRCGLPQIVVYTAAESEATDGGFLDWEARVKLEPGKDNP